MQRVLSKIDQIEDPVDLYGLVFEFGQKSGLVRAFFHMSPGMSELNGPEITVNAWGFSEEWLSLYEHADFRSKDPIPSRILKHGTLLKWTDAMNLEPNNEDHEEYFAAMEKFGLIDGFGFPLYGSRGRETFASMDFGKPLEEIHPQTIADLRAVASTVHQRICVLIDRDRHIPNLSKREKEVLLWIGRGKSVSSIALILDLSSETVKTYSNRLNEKLGVTDRVSLVVTAMKLGLLRY